MNDDTTHVNLAHAREKHQRDVMKQIQKDNVCPFCHERLMQYHTKPILHETEHWIVTTNFASYKGSKYHFLLIAQMHCEYSSDLSDAAKLDFFAVQDWIKHTYDVKGGSTLMRWGDSEYTGASVTHLHAHLVVGAPRTKDGEFILTALAYKVEE